MAGVHGPRKLGSSNTAFDVLLICPIACPIAPLNRGVFLCAGHPPGGHPPAGHPPAGHPPAGHPPAGHPPAGHPPAGHPPRASTCRASTCRASTCRAALNKASPAARPRDQICTARCAGRVSLGLLHLPLLFCAILWRGPRPVDPGSP
jgi:hypothetical protein